MPPQDSPDDFSHLPAVDESGRDREADLWARHRKGQKQIRVGPAAAKPPTSEPTPSVPNDAPAPDAAAWRSLLELEAEPVAYQSIPAAPPPKPPPGPRRKTVVRPVNRQQEEPAPAAPAEVEPPPVAFDAKPAPPEGPGSEPQTFDERETPPVKPADRRAEPPSAADDGSAKTLAESKDQPEAAAAETEKQGETSKVKVEPGPATPPSLWRRQWEKVGGLALSWSVGIHLLVIGVGGFLVVSQTMDTQIDFLPGGGTQQQQAASQDLEHKIQQKKNPWLKRSMPIQRLAAMDKISDVVIPDQAPDLLSLPDADLLKQKVGGGMGLGGAGGGFGSGMGLGSRSGMVFQPLSMFGREIKAKKMALVLDVSASMAPHLPRVIAEVDKVAKDSIVVLYVGCGLEPPPPGKRLTGDMIFRTSGQEFEKFWRLGGGTYEEARSFRINQKDPIPMESVFRLLARRPQTYFIHAVGVSYTWIALLSNEVRSADALYWFSDFQDSVNFRQVGVVKENLLNRKQRLYIHAYQRGSAFDLVVSQLVEPTGGDVIEATE